MRAYRSLADIGGHNGYGSVIPEAEGELFHAAWEPKAFALTVAMGSTGSWNIDMSRAARETLPAYAELSYYAIWIHGLEKLLAERGLVTEEEIAAERPLHPPRTGLRVLTASNVSRVLAAGSSTLRPAAAPPRFAIGERVRTRNMAVPHHTRLPGYTRGKLGHIERIHGTHIFADTHAQGVGEQPHWLYTVNFAGRELWGSDAESGLTVSIDAWEPYLEAAA